MERPFVRDPFECTDEIPMHWVRANQSGILICIIASVLAQQLWILVLPLLVQLVSRTFGVKYNLFVRLLSPLFPASTKTESRELLRFNNLLAILFLLAILVGAAFQLPMLSYIGLGMITVAVVLALCGFCLGCFIYFHWKQFWTKRTSH